MTLIYTLAGLMMVYLVLTLWLTYIVHQVPRKPVADPPDWGSVTDARIPTREGGFLEVWRIEPDSPARGVVVFAHGWSRNRDRMVARARYFGRWGFSTVIHSARDHGGSSPRRFMNAMKFAEDIETVLAWVGEPLILYGHSAGAAGAIIAAARNPEKIRLLFLEGCYADTREALLNLYRWYNHFLGTCFGPMILLWMNLMYKNGLDKISPKRLALKVKAPVMIIHGEKDQRFPAGYATELQRCFPGEGAELYLAPGADHSESSKTPGYAIAVKSFLERHGYKLT